MLSVLASTCIAVGGLCVDYVQQGQRHYVVVEKPGIKAVIDVTDETLQGDSAAVVKKVCSKVKCKDYK